MLNYIETENSITLITSAGVKQFSEGDLLFSEISRLINEEDFEGIESLISDPNGTMYSDGKLNVTYDGIVTWDGGELPEGLGKHIIAAIANKRPLKSITMFISRLEDNPSKTAWDGLFRFIRKNDLPITASGTFLTYKRIRDDYTDVHSGTIDNSVGTTVKMKRRDVTDDPNIHCSHGLHVCSRGYLRHFPGDRLVVCEVDPINVVSVPHDYDGTKMRVCEYTVIQELDLEEVLGS